MSNYYGKIDLTRLGQIVKAHPERIQRVKFKDGEHQLLDIDIREKVPDNYGNAAYIKVGVRNADKKEGINYYVADLKVSQFGETQTQQAETANNPVLSALNDAFGTNIPTQAEKPVKTQVNGEQNELPF